VKEEFRIFCGRGGDELALIEKKREEKEKK